MSIEENKAIVRRHLEEGVNRGNVADIEEWAAPDFVDHEAAPGRECGPASVRVTVVGQRAAFPDRSVTIEDIITEGDRVVVRNTWRGTHLGPWRGIAPTGKPVTSTGVVI